jgi:sugar phosphate isomerase/epimerase
MGAMQCTRREALAGAAAWAVGALLPDRAFADPPARAGGFELGLQSFTLRKFPLESMLDAVARLGLRQVELIPDTRFLFYSFGSHLPIDTDAAGIENVHAALAARGLRLSASGVHGVADAVEAERLFRFARQVRIPLLTIAPEDEALDALDRLCGAHPDVRLGIHNHGPYFRYDKIADVEQALAGRHPGFGACVDTGHFIRSGEDPAEAMQRLGARVHGVHLKDFRDEGFFADGCVLGEGKLQLDPCFRALREIGFGPEQALSIEYEENPDDPIADAMTCVRAATVAAERVERG